MRSTSTIRLNNNGKQTSGLPPVASFVPPGCSSRSSAEKASFLRSTDHLPPKKRAALKKSSSFFVVCVPGLHTVASCVRRGYCVRNTNPQEKCGSVFASTAPYFFSGCSFAQPSGFAPLSLCI